MKTFRYFSLMLFVLVPALAMAQPTPPDSVNFVVAGIEYGGWGSVFALGPQFEETIGPLPVVQVLGDGTTSPPEEGCDPLTNGAEVSGNIAFISRGSCTFVLKIQNAAAAGAVAVIVYMDDRFGPDDTSLVQMGGECEAEDGCPIPAAFISRASALAAMIDIKFGEEGTIVPIRIADPPVEPANAALDSGVIQTSLFGDGFIGKDPTFIFGDGFTFDGTDPLFVSSVLVAIGDDVKTNPYDGVSEFTQEQAPASVAGPYDAPYASFDQAARTVFSSDQVRVTVTGYADMDAPNNTFIPYDVSVTNISGGDLNDVYIGIFADWDAGAASGDDAGYFDAATQMPYVSDPVEGTAFYGVAASTAATLSGYSTDASTADDPDLLNALTSNNTPAVDPVERAAVTGTGPYSIANGATQTVRFAYVGGADEATLLANAAAAQAVISVPVAVEETTPAGTFVLESAYPNPLSSKTTIGFELPTAQDVRIAVYDVLGRQVATLVDGTRQAGPQTVEFDATDLPSGVYVYRLEAGSTQLAQRITVVR